MPPSTPQTATVQPAEETPIYVNVKQFHRILKRRAAREKRGEIQERLGFTWTGRMSYLHQSRHNHAIRRPRGPGGRFLSVDEIAAMKEGSMVQLPFPPENDSKVLPPDKRRRR
jgi:nuclear transcription factor Y, alpha